MTIIEKTKKIIIPVLRKHHVTRAGVFGSYSRGDMTKNSDIDMLIEIKKRITLFDFIDLKLELEGCLGKKVDLVEYSAIKPALKQRILNEEIQIL